MDVVLAATIASALADVTRLRVLRLSDGERAVGKIATELNVSPSDVSFHVTRLREVGLVEVVEHGREHRPRRTHGAWEALVRALTEPG